MNHGGWLFLVSVAAQLACSNRPLSKGDGAAGDSGMLGVGGAAGTGDGGTVQGGGGATGGGAGTGTGGTSAPVHGACRALDPNPDNQRIACDGAEALVLLANPVVMDDGNDGALSPGEGATIALQVTNTGTKTVYIPCVGIAPTTYVPAGAPPWDQAFGAIAAQQTQTFYPHIVVSSSTPPGSTLSLTAYVAVAGADCTNVNNLDFSISVTR